MGPRDPAECDGLGITKNKYTCVAPYVAPEFPTRNKGITCLDRCKDYRKAGIGDQCPFCGGGLCCKAGATNDPAACAGRGGRGYHKCIDRAISDTTTTTTGLAIQDAMIVFPGTRNRNDARSVEAFDWDATNGRKTMLTKMKRPEWQKTTRCWNVANDTEMCEECNATAEDCWGAERGDRRGLKVTEQGKIYTRFVNTIHVRCNSPQLSIRFSLPRNGMQNGRLTMYWDGVEITRKNGYYNYAREEGEQPLPWVWPTPFWQNRGHQNGKGHRSRELYDRAFATTVDVSGDIGHELEVEFKVMPNITADGFDDEQTRVSIKDLTLYMGTDFASCEDGKVCLWNLGNRAARRRNKQDMSGLALRNSNALQLECLETPLVNMTPGSVCEEWRECLDDDYALRIRTLLRTAKMNQNLGGGSISQPVSENVRIKTQRKGKLKSKRALRTHCMDPLLEDPESWQCDCYETMMIRCASVDPPPSDELCLRLHFCTFERVCTAWKEGIGNCEAPEVKALKESLFPEGEAPVEIESLIPAGEEPALVARASGRFQAITSQKTSTSMEETLSSKHCV